MKILHSLWNWLTYDFVKGSEVKVDNNGNKKQVSPPPKNQGELKGNFENFKKIFDNTMKGVKDYFGKDVKSCGKHLYDKCKERGITINELKSKITTKPIFLVKQPNGKDLFIWKDFSIVKVRKTNNIKTAIKGSYYYKRELKNGKNKI